MPYLSLRRLVYISKDWCSFKPNLTFEIKFLPWDQIGLSRLVDLVSGFPTKAYFNSGSLFPYIFFSMFALQADQLLSRGEYLQLKKPAPSLTPQGALDIMSATMLPSANQPDINRGGSILAACGTMTVLALAAVCCRIWVRARMVHSIGPDVSLPWNLLNPFSILAEAC